MKKYWVRQTYWTDDFHLEPGNPHKRVPFYLAADVEQRDEQLAFGLEKIRAATTMGSEIERLATQLLERIGGKG